METSEVTVPVVTAPTRPPRRPFQFGLRTLFLVMTAIALSLSALLVLPSWLTAAAVVVVMVLVPMCLTIGIVYGRGYVRTFAIGALFPCGFILAWVSPFGLIIGVNLYGLAAEAGNWLLAVGVLAGLTISVAFGFSAVGVRWVIEPHTQPMPTGSDSTPC